MTQSELEDILKICNKATPAPWISYVEGRDFDSGSSFIMTGEMKAEIMILNL